MARTGAGAVAGLDDVVNGGRGGCGAGHRLVAKD